MKDLTGATVVRTEASAGDSLLRAEGISKAFGPTRALREACLELRAGEIHSVVGENGSGKSTLVKILSGIYAPDSGTIIIDGISHSYLTPPAFAQASGVATVFQEVLLAPARSVLDNVWAGQDSILRSRVPKEERRERASELLDELLGRRQSLNTPVENLSLSDRYAVSIVRALLRRPRVLILDESTSALDIATRDRLFALVRRVASQGVGVVMITHRMDEMEEISDRITVLRTGETVGTVSRDAWDPTMLVRMMTGSDTVTEYTRSEQCTNTDDRCEVVVTIRQLRLSPEAAPFDAEVRSGELLGLAGLEGQGQERFLETLWGLHDVAKGEVVCQTRNGERPIHNRFEAAALGIGHVPRDRARDSIFSWMSIRENFAIATLTSDRERLLLRPAKSRRRLEKYIERLSIKLGDPGDSISTLSGGNQQKVIISRWLASEPRILLLNDPTRGVDIQTKRELYALLKDLVKEGMAVVMLSTEVDEHVALMDRVFVFRDATLFREMDGASLTREALVASFFGQGQ